MPKGYRRKVFYNIVYADKMKNYKLKRSQLKYALLIKLLLKKKKIVARIKVKK